MEKETVVDRGVFYGAINRVSEKLEVWGFPALGDCESSRSFVESVLERDYFPPSGCAVVKFEQPPPATSEIGELARDASGRPSERENVLRATFKHACYTGCAMAQVKLPKVPQEDELLGRGFLSCDGRLQTSPAVIEEDNILTNTCGYAVGAMFAKYGLGHEVMGPDGRVNLSRRALDSLHLCLRELAKQKIPGAQAELADFERALPRLTTGTKRTKSNR